MDRRPASLVRLLAVPIALAAAGLATSRARAQEVVPVGPSFRVGGHFDYDTGLFGDGYTRDARIAPTSDGGFVVVWAGVVDKYPLTGAGVFGRRLDAAGQPAGGEFDVFFHTDSSEYLFRPSVAADPAGGFIVVWGEFDGFGRVWAQRHDAAGVPRAPRFQVNESEADTGFTQARNEIATDPTGGFLVVWENRARNDVFARRYDAADVPQGPEFQVNATTTSIGAAYTSVAADGSGNFIVVWDGRQAGQAGVFGQRFDPAATPIGGEFRMLSRDSGEDPVRVAAGPAGNFMVVNPNLGRVFDASGVATGPEFNTGADYGGVAADRQGNFIVAWSEPDYGVFGRRYDPTGQPIGSVFTISDGPVGDVGFNDPSTAADARGDFVVVWSNAYEEVDPPYRVFQGVYARRMAVCGDGRLGPLACDDGNSAAFDGCGPRCEVDTCYGCSGEPSSCAQIPGCTTVCSTAAAVDDKAFLTIKKILPPAGDESITFRGSILDPPLAPAAYNPAVEGAEIAVTGTDLLYQRTTPTPVPPGVRGTGCGPVDGWKVSGRAPNLSYTYKNLTNALPPACVPGSANGLRVVKFKDRLARDRTFQFQVSVKNATLPPVPGAPLVATVVLGQSPDAGQAGRCARIRFGTDRISGSTARYSP